MTGFTAAYSGARARIQELGETTPEAVLDTMVPACPEWTVKELLAHLCGVAADSIASDLRGVGSPEWTAKQVHARRDRPLNEIFAEWNSIAAQIEPGLDGIHPTLASALIGDAITHEHDLRGALGRDGARDSDGLAIALAYYVRRFGKRLKDARLPTILVKTGEQQELTAGLEQPIGHVAGSPFEMLRALTGRRTLDEVKGLDWSVDAAPYLELFPTYPPTQDSLNE